MEYGVELDGVWLPIPMLRRLAAHDPWGRPLTEATADQERVLVAHSLAERHNQQGLHRGIGISGFLEAIPFEPTVPFPAVPDEQPERPEKPPSRQPRPRDRPRSPLTPMAPGRTAGRDSPAVILGRAGGPAAPPRRAAPDGPTRAGPVSQGARPGR